jgi:hypothetical protein
MSAATLAPSPAVCALVRLGEAYAHLLKAKRLRRDPSTEVDAPVVSLPHTTGKTILDLKDRIAKLAGLDPKKHWGEADRVRTGTLPFTECEEHVSQALIRLQMARDDAADLMVDEHRPLLNRFRAAEEELENALRSIRVTRDRLPYILAEKASTDPFAAFADFPGWPD